MFYYYRRLIVETVEFAHQLEISPWSTMGASGNALQRRHHNIDGQGQARTLHIREVRLPDEGSWLLVGSTSVSSPCLDPIGVPYRGFVHGDVVLSIQISGFEL